MTEVGVYQKLFFSNFLNVSTRKNMLFKNFHFFTEYLKKISIFLIMCNLAGYHSTCIIRLLCVLSSQNCADMKFCIGNCMSMVIWSQKCANMIFGSRNFLLLVIWSRKCANLIFVPSIFISVVIVWNTE